MSKAKVVIFASGTGTNAQAIIEHSLHDQNSIYTVAGLITNNPRAGVVERCKLYNVPVEICNEKDYVLYNDFVNDLLEKLTQWNPHIITLAGYVRLVPDVVVRAYPNKIINVHPALLPKHGGKGMYGIHVHTSVINNRDCETGCTFHFVTEEYDQGAIIEQFRVPVYLDDTAESLQKRVQELERANFPVILSKLLS